MSDHRDRTRGEGDAELHAYLDDELGDGANADFEARMRQDPRLARTVGVLGSFDRWLEETRETAPGSLRDRVQSQLSSSSVDMNRTRPHDAATSRSTTRRWTDLVRLPVWAWAGAGAMAAAILFLVFQPQLPRHEGAAGVDADVLTTDAITTDAIVPGVAAPSGFAEATLADHADGASGATPPDVALSLGDTIRHRFTIEAQDASRVCLVGSFNRWTVCKTPLEEVRTGVWAATLELPRGRYEYMFVVDDHWVTDPNSGVRVDDGFGNENAVLLL
ncbi:MAG: hypothetical protein R3E97_11800 [Candidatus Eisenbacteria bacterium]